MKRVLPAIFDIFKIGVVTGDFTFQVSGNEKSMILFNHLAGFIENTWYTRVVIDFSIIGLFIGLAYALGLIYYRVGPIGSVGTMGVVAILFIIGIANGWLSDLIQTMVSNFNLSLFYQVFGISVIIYLLSFLLIRRITIK